MRRTRLAYRIAGVTISVVIESEYEVYDDSALEAFRTNDEQPELTVSIDGKEPPSLEHAQVLYDENAWASVFRLDDELVYRFTIGDPCAPFPYRAMSYNENRHTASLFLRQEGLAAPVVLHPLERPLCTLLLMNYLAQRAGVLFHSCGVADGFAGYLFVGPSTVGKSTMARIWRSVQGARVLGDEYLVVRRIGTQFCIYGTPWAGDAGTADPCSCQLRSVFFLEHAPANFATRVGASAALVSLLRESFPEIWNSHRMEPTLELLSEIAGGIPCFRLGFVPDAGIVDFVRSLR